MGVAGLGEIDQMHEFIALTKTSGLLHLADQEGAVWRQFEVRAQSMYVLLDGSGAVAYSGFLDGDELAGWVAALVA
ncbi:MAG: hypothetical protein ACRDWI_08985 [Jiangellaceae bacterium]